MVDTHAHIYADEFSSDRADMLERGFEKGLSHIWMPNIDHTSVDGMLELEAKYPKQCIPMMGLHPCYVKKDFEKELYQVENWLNRRKFLAIGEIGLDFYWDTTFRAQQEEAFRVQVRWAHQHRLPIIIHCRNSFQETVALLEEMAIPDLRGIFHCFSGNLDDARKAIELNFLLGIGGVVTFKNGGLDKVLPEIELKHLVLETDCPYLAPVPHRGKRNESGFLPLIAQKIADLKQVSMEIVAETTTQNALHLTK
ncbi:MAG: TatD family hydrolase [Bacteroidota bacterium]